MGAPHNALDDYRRETAEGAPASAPPATARMFSEDEAYAIAADRVKAETAKITEENEKLKGENIDLQSKLDVSAAALETEKAAREAADKAFEDYKGEAAAKAEAASRQDERVGKVKEAAPHMGEDFFTQEKAARWASMEQTEFDTYVAELAAVAPKTPGSPGQPPRETAASGRSVEGAPKGAEATRSLFAVKRGA